MRGEKLPRSQTVGLSFGSIQHWKSCTVKGLEQQFSGVFYIKGRHLAKRDDVPRLESFSFDRQPIDRRPVC